MRGYLLDTDVIGRAGKPDGANVRGWLATIDDHELAISALTVFEIAKGVEKARARGAPAADRLQASLDTLTSAFAGRIYPVETAAAERWGILVGGGSDHLLDKGHAAIAAVNGLVLVTLNSKDLRGLGAELLNPGRKPPQRYAPDGSSLP